MRTKHVTRVKRAFTLIEILIVVVILGILAAIVIPQFTDASQDAMSASVRSQLQTIRSQIELYNVQNPADAYGNGSDDVSTFWNRLVINDYLQQAPRNPMQDGAVVVAAGPNTGVGWVWDGNDIFAVNANGAVFIEGPGGTT